MMQIDNLFDERRKTLVHIVQVVLIVLAIILSIGRVTIKNPPASRANTVAITLVRVTLTTRLDSFPHTSPLTLHPQPRASNP
jgi:hypothetical protein